MKKQGNEWETSGNSFSCQVGDNIVGADWIEGVRLASKGADSSSNLVLKIGPKDERAL